MDAAWAQGRRQGFRQGPVAACLSDYQRLCPGVRPGGGRIIVCLNAQAEKLSQQCFQALAEHGLAFAAVLRLCRPDYERLCPGVPTGTGRALGCLMDNHASLAPPCRDALSAHGYDGDGEGEAIPPGPPPGRAAPGPAPPSAPSSPGREQLPWQK